MSRTRLTMLKLFTWLHLFGVPALISTTTDISHLPRPSGRVTLFSFERGNLRTVTDQIDQEVVLTMPPRYFEAYLFECNASYPIQWAYIGEAAPVVTADVGRFFQDFYDVNTYTYQSILLMYSLQELQSGRYICRGASKEHDKLAIHYDVFVPGNGTQILLSTTEKKLFVPENKEHAYIPCGVSDSTAEINLYRGNQWGTFYPVPSNGSITFNPRKGFKIRFKDFLDPWGTYLCVSAGNKKRRKVHLIPENLKAKYDLINHVSGKIPVYFSYEYEYNRVLCCTGTNFIPKLQWAGCGSILDCQVKSACFEEDRCEQRLGTSGYNPTKWIDPGPLPQGCSGHRLRDDPNGDFGLFKCATPGIAQYQPYLLNRGSIFLDFEKTPPSEMILTLQRISPEGPSYVGDELEFHCNSTRFYFAYGIRWGWEKYSGEIDFVDDAKIVRDKYSIRGHRRRTTLKIPHSDIKSIVCFVPVVNSATEWRTVSLPVVVTAHDPNYIPHEKPAPPPPNNVIDLDSLTYHTDYDAPLSPPPVPSAIHHHQPQAQALQQQQPVYNGPKAPYQEVQSVVVSSSSGEQNHNGNPNYYSYTHDSSAEPQIHQIPSNNIEPLSQPQTVDIFSPYSEASTPAPNIIAISRSNKKSRSRSGLSSKAVPVSKSDIIYDTSSADRDYYDTFEPRPSSSRNSNSRLHHRHQQDKEKSVQSTRTPHYSSSPSSSSRRPSSSSSPISYRRQNNNNYREEIQYTSPKKSYRDYNNYNEKHEIGVDMRLSLPFEPIIPSSGRGRYAYANNNYSTISNSRDVLPLRTSSSSSRSNSRRPSTPEPSTHHTSSSSRTHHHKHHSSHSHPEKDYSIDDSYSQHVRLSLPPNSLSTQLPTVQKSARSRPRTQPPSHPGHHERGRSHSSSTHAATTTRGRSHHYDNNHPRNPDYYYTSDDSPVEIKVPRTKSHEPYHHSRPHLYREQHRNQGSSGSSSSSHVTPTKDVLYRDSSIEPEFHEASPTTYNTRRRPHSDDTHSQSRPTSTQPSSVYGHEQDDISHAGSSGIGSSSRQYYYQHGRYHHQSLEPEQEHHQHHENYKSSSGRHRSSYSRGMKFEGEADPSVESGLPMDAYELVSPTARPIYFIHSTTPNPKYGIEMPEEKRKVASLHLQTSNELVSGADVDLKRLHPSASHPRSTPVPIELRRRPPVKPESTNSSDIMHSVSISISSRITHAGKENGGADTHNPHIPVLAEHHNSDGTILREKSDSEANESEDYDVYSPRYTNYKASTIAPTTNRQVPIQFFHVKPTDMSSFQPAKSIVDEEDEDELG